jgi:hypothetical protein
VVALAYWPGRWRRAIVVAALSLEPFADNLTPDEWSDYLDRLDVASAGALTNEDRFP